jgi:DNA polymerase elongation subunit (family B)
MLYETDPMKGKRKSMGIVLKRRDNAPIVKDVYGGIIDILMKEKNIQKAVEFLQDLFKKYY